MRVPAREYYGTLGQYHRGDIEVDPQFDQQVKQIINCGLEFTIENLPMLNKVSLCLEDYDRGDYKIEFVEPNNKAIENATEKIVSEFSINDYLQWCNEFDSYDDQFED